MSKLQLLTDSRLRAARRCLRLHYYQYELGYQAIRSSDAQGFGSLWHHAQEAWWNWYKQAAEQPEMIGLDLPESALDAALIAIEQYKVETNWMQIVWARALSIVYDARWCDSGLEPLQVEKEFRAKFINPETGRASQTWEQGGKIDAILRENSTGRVYVREAKTTSLDIGPSSTYWRRLMMDSQITMYFGGSEALGFQVDGCLYDVVRKPGSRPYKATPEDARKYTQPKYKQCPLCKKKGSAPPSHNIEIEEKGWATCEDDPEGGPRRICTDPGGKLYANLREFDETQEEYEKRLIDDIVADPDKYFQRGHIMRLESELVEHRSSVWQTAQALQEARRLNRHPMNPDACERYNQLCVFFDVCTKQVKIDDPLRFVKSGPHPELEAETSED